MDKKTLNVVAATEDDEDSTWVNRLKGNTGRPSMQRCNKGMVANTSTIENIVPRGKATEYKQTTVIDEHPENQAN